MEDVTGKLPALRDRIDDIDSRLVKLYCERMEVSASIADVKQKAGMKIYDPAREEEKIKKVREQAKDELGSFAVGELFRQIMSVSKKIQYKKLEENGAGGRLPFICVDELFSDNSQIRVVFQGAKGSYSEAAMYKYFGKELPAFHVDSFREAMAATSEGSADFAVLPIENSTAGTISEIYDLLDEFENYVVGEQIIPIRHCLLGLEDAAIEDIQRVYSHPQSLMQCADFLNGYPWEQISMPNNAFAADKVKKDGDKVKAAIASEYAGECYGLKVLKKDINSSGSNSTRFIVVTNQKIFLKGAGRISISFELPHRSGSLYQILSHFIYNDLNLTRIESRPIPERDWEYRFFIDFEGNLGDGAVKNALSGLRQEARAMKILGNY